VLIAAVVAVLAMNTGARRLGPANAALFMNLVPVVTFGVQIARGYQPLGVEIVGAVITVGALVAANLIVRERREKQVRIDAIPVSAAALVSFAGRR
jgi:drug/metabolite transporter (DMT)-like permease